VSPEVTIHDEAERPVNDLAEDARTLGGRTRERSHHLRKHGAVPFGEECK
jgi:hypothetical protein